jgi:hypothetical protein
VSPRHCPHPTVQSAAPGFVEEVTQRGLEDAVVVVMDGHGHRRVQQLHQVCTLSAIHRDGQTEELGAAQVQDGSVEGSAAVDDLLEPGSVQGVATDVDPERRLASSLELEHAPHDRRQEWADRSRRVGAGDGGDSQRGGVALQVIAAPGLDALRPPETPAVQPVPGLRSGDDGQVTDEPMPGHAIEVVTVEVRQHDGVEWGQLVGLHRGLGEAAGPQALAEIRALAPVQEVRVRQQGERTQPQQGRRGADELQALLGHAVG